LNSLFLKSSSLYFIVLDEIPLIPIPKYEAICASELIILQCLTDKHI